MKNLIILSAIFFFSIQMSLAQSVQVNEDYGITRMLERHSHTHKSKTEVSGWRVQILSTTDRMRMEQAKEDFLNNYPAERVEWEHAKPYYRLRVGAFPTKLEAIKLLYELKKDYPSAYPAMDNTINPRDFL